jgi:hypothetical protein
VGLEHCFHTSQLWNRTCDRQKWIVKLIVSSQSVQRGDTLRTADPPPYLWSYLDHACAAHHVDHNEPRRSAHTSATVRMPEECVTHASETVISQRVALVELRSYAGNITTTVRLLRSWQLQQGGGGPGPPQSNSEARQLRRSTPKAVGCASGGGATISGRKAVRVRLRWWWGGGGALIDA